jgi:hypothetical protein
MKRPRKMLRSEIEYIDPLNCDSTVGYTVGQGSRGVFGSVDLSDCNRKITWHFGRYDGNDKSRLAKIDRAIGLLIRFRSELDSAMRQARRRKRRA